MPDDSVATSKLLFWPVGQGQPDPRHYLRAVPVPADATPQQRSYYFVTLDEERERAASEEFKHRIGALLRELRGERPRHEVATYLGVHHNTIAKIERGEVMVDAWALLRLSRLFDYPIEQMYEAVPAAARPTQEDITREFIMVPEYGVRASAGVGSLNDSEEIVGRFAFRRAWLASRNMRPETLAVVSAHGDSMEPTVRDADILLVDTSVTNVRADGIYLIEQSGELRCKRLQAMVDGGVRIRSDNPRYETEVVSPEHVELLRVVAKVLWIGGER